MVGLLSLAAACSGGAVDSPWAAPPSSVVDLKVAVAPVEVGLMQPVLVTMDLYRGRDVEVTFKPEFNDEDWVEQGRELAVERALGDGFWQRTTVTLLPIAGPGELRTPELRAEARGADGQVLEAATASEVAVQVQSVLTDEHGAEIEAPGDLFDAPTAWWWWAGAVAVLAALALLVVASRRRRSAAPAPVSVLVPAHVRALRDLQRWRGAAHDTPAEIEAFYVGVSQVLRVYLEQRFGMRAPERTTEEFLRDLESGDVLARQHSEELERFLSQCDMVKFAKAVPRDDEHDRTFALAESFVQATRADRRGGESAKATVEEIQARVKA